MVEAWCWTGAEDTTEPRTELPRTGDSPSGGPLVGGTVDCDGSPTVSWGRHRRAAKSGPAAGERRGGAMRVAPRDVSGLSSLLVGRLLGILDRGGEPREVLP